LISDCLRQHIRRLPSFAPFGNKICPVICSICHDFHLLSSFLQRHVIDATQVCAAPDCSSPTPLLFLITTFYRCLFTTHQPYFRFGRHGVCCCFDIPRSDAICHMLLIYLLAHACFANIASRACSIWCRADGLPILADFTVVCCQMPRLYCHHEELVIFFFEFVMPAILFPFTISLCQEPVILKNKGAYVSTAHQLCHFTLALLCLLCLPILTERSTSLY